MNAISLGPLVFSNERLHAVIALAVFLAMIELGDRLRPARAGTARSWSLIVLIGWIVAARAGFVLINLEAYAADPLTVFAIWQGGFSLAAGVLGLALLAAVALWQRTAALRPVALAVVLSGGAYAAAGWALPAEVRGQLPPIALPALDGTRVPLADAAGRPVVVNLWASWCPPCRREMPMMMDLAESRDDVVLRFANQGEDRSAIQRYLDSQQLSAAAVVQDIDSRLMADFDLLGLPSTLFFAPDGRLVSVHTGEISRAALTNQMNDLTQETP